MSWKNLVKQYKSDQTGAPITLDRASQQDGISANKSNPDGRVPNRSAAWQSAAWQSAAWQSAAWQSAAPKPRITNLALADDEASGDRE